MRSIINILVGFLYSLAPISLAAVLSLFIYNDLPNYIGIIIISILGVFSIWLGIKIFNKIQVVGPIEFISAVSASPDMDNLEPTANSSTKRRHPKELVDLIKQKNNLLKGGSFRIFGDWYGKPYDNLHIIKNANFDSNESKLTIEFEGQEILEIFNPKHIFEASTFLKIIKADRIKLIIQSEYNDENSFVNYKIENKKIITNTSILYEKSEFNVSLGDSALMIYGKL